MSVVTFGLFFADAGTAIAGGGQVGGWGLWLSLVGWLACAGGSALALLLRPAGGLSTAGVLSPPRGGSPGPVVLLVLAGFGAAAAFAPAWDSYTLRNATGLTRSLTAGNAFSNPGLVVAGDVAFCAAPGLAGWPHDRLWCPAGLLDLLRIPPRAGRLVRVDALDTARGGPIGLRPRGRRGRLPLACGRASPRAGHGRGQQCPAAHAGR